MNIIVAFALFALIVLLYWVISELFTILFRFTGLPYGKARFQVTSILTGCGFTTRESEMLLTTKSRRRLARVTMLFGYVFNITVVTTIINVFLSLKEMQEAKDFLLAIVIPLVVVAFIIVFVRVPSMRMKSDRLLEKIAGKMLKIEGVNTMVILDHIGRNAIVRITLVEVPEAYQGVPLAWSGLKEDKNILVMLIEKQGKGMRQANAETKFDPGDRITVLGDYRTISETFNARENFESDEA